MQASQNSSQPILNLIRSAPMTSIYPCTKPLNLSPLSSIKYTVNYSKWCHIIRWIMQFGWICMQYLWTRINTFCQRQMQRIKGWLPFIIFACQTHIKKLRRELTKLQKHNQTSWSCFFFCQNTTIYIVCEKHDTDTTLSVSHLSYLTMEKKLQWTQDQETTRIDMASWQESQPISNTSHYTMDIQIPQFLTWVMSMD